VLVGIFLLTDRTLQCDLASGTAKTVQQPQKPLDAASKGVKVFHSHFSQISLPFQSTSFFSPEKFSEFEPIGDLMNALNVY
jgi:hypothetical protein